MALLPVNEARKKILKGVKPLAGETVALSAALGRVLAVPVTARRDQPPFDASAMDGYAVRHEDAASAPSSLKLVGSAAAGHAFKGRIKPGEAARIFTGAPVPAGADTIVIQENAEAGSASRVTVLEAARPDQHIRRRGLDFKKGEILLAAGTRLNARDIGLAASANAAMIRVRRKPVVALIATGDELVPPGRVARADQIHSSNSHALEAMIAGMGGIALNLGIVGDRLEATKRAVKRAARADILVTTGGASVGDHDFVQDALKASGVKIDFWKIAMRPGKPFMYGRKGRQHVMGLPGNPVSALVCARLFLRPLVDGLLGLPGNDELVLARLGSPLKANDSRQDYVRAAISLGPDGARTATPFSRQDSSMQRTFREAQCLIVRPPRAPAAEEGALVPVLLVDF